MRATLFLLLICLGKLQAQVPAFALHKDSAAAVALPASYVQVLKEKKEALSFAQVQSIQLQNGFQPAAVVNSSRLYPGVYWLHYKVKNAAATPLQTALTSAAGYVTFYVRRNQSAWAKMQSGFYQPWRSKDGFKTTTSIPYTLLPGEEAEVYQRESYWLQLPVFVTAQILYPQNKAVEQYTRQNMSTGFSALANQLLSALISGILLFAGIIYVWFFFTVRIRFYFFYALFLLGFSLLYSPVNVFFRSLPLVSSYISNFAFAVGLLSFAQFFRSYLRTAANYPRWDKWLLLVSLLPMLFFLLNAVFYHLLPGPVAFFSLKWGARSFLLVLDSLLVTAVLYIRKRNMSAGVIACIPALLLWGMGQTYKLVYTLTAANLTAPSGLLRWMNENNYLVDLISIIWIVSVFSSLLFQRFQHLQKKVLREAVKNERLKRQKEQERRALIAKQKTELEQQVEERTSELKRANRELVTALRNLKEMQQQLVQSEKMASLGELTAGIAHEIQNPLNFINNFSEVGTELAQEIEEAVQSNNKEEAIAITKEIRESLHKIARHGRRAEGIVKGMLQHSRVSAGDKEPVNINTLADEYLRLSYHGLRAKNKSFSANYSTHLDPAIGEIEVVPQEIGRVLLNLFNNAFYAVNERKNQQDETYEPEVQLHTKLHGDKIEIVVKDNGTGIPPKLVDKIFQPFFTTKPTGEGTGLGLSLSYDIITKGHGGELKVESKVGEGTVFKIFLPAQTNGVNFKVENANVL